MYLRVIVQEVAVVDRHLAIVRISFGERMEKRVPNWCGPVVDGCVEALAAAKAPLVGHAPPYVLKRGQPRTQVLQIVVVVGGVVGATVAPAKAIETPNKKGWSRSTEQNDNSRS